MYIDGIADIKLIAIKNMLVLREKAVAIDLITLVVDTFCAIKLLIRKAARSVRT